MCVCASIDLIEVIPEVNLPLLLNLLDICTMSTKKQFKSDFIKLYNSKNIKITKLL